MKKLLVTAALSFALFTSSGAMAAGEAESPPELSWTFQGIFGTYDKNQLQRGMQVYKEVCASCHGLKYVRFRNLEALGFNEDQIKAIASDYEVEDGPNADGDMFFRTAIPADAFPSPFPNAEAARAANGGAYPPDLSLQAKRNGYGADYIAALLSGYASDVPTDNGLYENPYFAGGLIAMLPPLGDDYVTYADGTEATLEQQSQDVAAFLMWAAEPKLEERKSMGIKVLLFLLILTGLFYVSKRKIWAKIHH